MLSFLSLLINLQQATESVKMSNIMEMKNSFNCLFLEDYSIIPIPIYNDDNKKFVKLYHERISVDLFTVTLLNEYIFKRKNVNNLKFWRVNVNLGDIKVNVSTEEDIKNKLNGEVMESNKLFKSYFQDELNRADNQDVENIHIIAIIPTIAPASATEKDINAIIGDLRKTFPHVNDADDLLFRNIAQKLAIIWNHSHEFSFETPNNPYVKPNPSIFKARLPYGVTKETYNEIDPRLPPFEASTEMIYENPLYYDPQFQETVNLVRTKINKYKQDVIVLAGVSGGGKTSTTFAIAAEHWGIHVDCSHIVSDYNNQLSGVLCNIRAKNPSFSDIRLQEWALHMLDMALVSRGLILIKMIVEKKIKTPKDWLLAQLHGLDNDSIFIISQNLSELGTEVFSTLIRSINKCLDIERILFIQDEAQCLCRPEFGEYTGSSEIDKPWNLLQAYTCHMVGSKFEVTHIISGTTMHMSTLVTSVGKFTAPRNVHLVLKLPYLSPDDVIRVLKTVINMDGVSLETLSCLGNLLKGRPRNCVSFIKMLIDRSEPIKDKDDEVVKTSKEWFEAISNTMVKYLRNTVSTLAIGGINSTNAIIDVACCRIINSKSAGAELLRHGILPVKSPPFITLLPHKVDELSFKINLELESYMIKSIEKYLELNNNETLTDIYVSHVLQRLGSSQSLGSELDAAFACAIIEKRGCNVLEELKKWTDDPDYIFPEWITPGMQFVTETNVSNNISLYDYVKDIYESTKYHNYSIQPAHHAGSDLVLSLVDKLNESKNVVLLSLSSTFHKEVVPASKVRSQAIKANMEFQYMTESDEKKEMRKRRRIDEKQKLDYSNDVGEATSEDIGLTEKFQKKRKLQEKSDETLLTNIYDDDIEDPRRNYDLDYDKTLKSYQVSKTPGHAELHHKIAGLMTANKISSNVADRRKCIHVLVELPHRALSKRPDIFRYDKNGNLIVIVDDRNVKQVFGEKLANIIMMRSNKFLN